MFLFSTPTILQVYLDSHILWRINEIYLLKLPYQRVVPYSCSVNEDFRLKYLISLHIIKPGQYITPICCRVRLALIYNKFLREATYPLRRLVAWVEC